MVTECAIAECKPRGEWVELMFMAKAAEHGLHVARPYGDSGQYDVAVEYEGRFRRVQVKSTQYRRRAGEYSLNVMGPGRRPYKKGTVDFFAVYLIPDEAWYIIPAQVMGGRCTLHLNLQGGRGFYERYREAWDLLKT